VGGGTVALDVVVAAVKDATTWVGVFVLVAFVLKMEVGSCVPVGVGISGT
jgi:hypothetical protein